MAVRKIGNNWQIDYYDPDGKRIRRNFKKKKDAVEELAKRTALIAEGRYLDVKKESTATMGELIEKYKEQYGNQAGFKTFKAYGVVRISGYFGENTKLADIRYYDLEKFRNYLRNTPTKHGGFPKESNVNRHMACLRHMFSKAMQWELIAENPFDRGKRLFLKENNQRTRFLSQEEVKRLLEACSTKIVEFPKGKRFKSIKRRDPDYLREIVETALLTGMRKSEILSLKWEQVRNGFIYLRKTKTNQARQIPISDALETVFKRIRKRQGPGCKYVFTYQGERVADIKSAFKAACKRAGIEDFRFHDCRHTAASHLIMNGASLKDVQEILGHATLTMVMRYAHLSQEHKRRAVNLLNDLTKPDGHKMVTIEETDPFLKQKRTP